MAKNNGMFIINVSLELWIRKLTATSVLLGIALWIEYKVVDGNDHVVPVSQHFEPVESFNKVDKGYMFSNEQVNYKIQTRNGLEMIEIIDHRRTFLPLVRW